MNLSFLRQAGGLLLYQELLRQRSTCGREISQRGKSDNEPTLRTIDLEALIWLIVDKDGQRLIVVES
jgi:hypothetical protein